MADDLLIAHGRALSAAHLSWTAVRASGAGGQNVNKVSSKVELRFDLEASGAFDEDEKTRIRTRLASRLDAAGRLVVTSQKTRDQSRNLQDARDKLVELLRAALVVPKGRTATKPTRSSQRRRLEGKRREALTKATRRVRDD